MHRINATTSEDLAWATSIEPKLDISIPIVFGRGGWAAWSSKSLGVMDMARGHASYTGTGTVGTGPSRASFNVVLQWFLLSDSTCVRERFIKLWDKFALQ